MTSGVYIIRNLRNGKVYIGSSANVPRRLVLHKNALSCGVHYNPHLQRAWNHYGADAFSFALLEACPLRSLVKREQFHMDSFDSMNGDKGYNQRGSERPDEITDEVRGKMSAAKLGKKPTAEHLARMKAACRTPEYRARIGAANLGRNLGRKFTPKQLARHRAIRRSPEWREKQSQALKRYWTQRREAEAKAAK
jgi:group I intron endonuclease